jgi:hypothetical protein
MQDHYLNRLRPAQLTLTWAECTAWVNSQDIPRQLFLANYLWLQQTKSSASAYPYEPTDDNLVTPPPAPSTERTEPIEVVVSEVIAV